MQPTCSQALQAVAEVLDSWSLWRQLSLLTRGRSGPGFERQMPHSDLPARVAPGLVLRGWTLMVA